MDIVIVYHEKDKRVANICVANIIKYIEHRNIYCISAKNSILKNTIHIDETLFPFSINDMKLGETQETTDRAGWYFQQFLKLYAYRVIENLSDTFLILDSDIIFLRKIIFTNNNKLLYSYTNEYIPNYFEHLLDFFPEVDKQFTDKSGIAHHMLFNKNILNEIFNIIEKKHKQLFWQAALKYIKNKFAGMSEYELYFNYIFKYKKDLVEIRKLNVFNNSEYARPILTYLTDVINNNISSIETVISAMENNEWDLFEMHLYTV